MTDKCRWCDYIHGPRCPLVKAIEYFEDGMVRRVEFYTPASTTRSAPILPTWGENPGGAAVISLPSDILSPIEMRQWMRR